MARYPIGSNWCALQLDCASTGVCPGRAGIPACAFLSIPIAARHFAGNTWRFLWRDHNTVASFFRRLTAMTDTLVSMLKRCGSMEIRGHAYDGLIFYAAFSGRL